MENKEIARLLAETADLMEIDGEDPFRVRSYRNGAATVESHPERLFDIVKDPERKLTEVPGVGKSLAVAIRDIVERGSCERRDNLLQKYPPAALEFLKIQGMGPKNVAMVFQHYGVKTIDELEQLCREQ